MKIFEFVIYMPFVCILVYVIWERYGNKIKCWLFPIWEIGGIYTIPRNSKNNPFVTHPYKLYKILDYKENWYRVQEVDITGASITRNTEDLSKFWLKDFTQKIN